MTVEQVIVQMKQNPQKVRFVDLCLVCEHYFGKPRENGTSHVVYKTHWTGDPRVNIQNDKGMAKKYQVKQVLEAIERLKNENASK
jgi:hypothetical protein